MSVKLTMDTVIKIFDKMSVKFELIQWYSNKDTQ